MKRIFHKQGQRNRRMSLFISITVTFLVLCAVFAIFSFLSIRSSTAFLKRERMEIGLSESREAASGVQNQFNSYLQLTDVIASSANIAAFSYQTDDDFSKWVHEALAIRSVLLSAQANFSDVYLHAVAVYYPLQQLAITSRMMYTTPMLDYFLSQYDLPDSFWKDLTPTVHGILFPSGDACWLTRGIYREGEIYAYVMLNFPLGQVLSSSFEEQDALAVCQGNHLFYVSDSSISESELIPLLRQTPQGTVGLNSRRYYMQTAQVRKLDVEIVALKDAEKDFSAIRSYASRGMLQTSLTLLIMLLLGFVFAIRIFQPIRQLLINAMVIANPSSVSQAMDSVSNTLQKLSDEKQQYQRSVQDAEYLVRGDRLQHTLALPDDILEDEYRLFLEELGFDPDSPVVSISIFYDPKVLSAYLTSLPDQFTEKHNQFFSLICFLLDGSLEDQYHFELFKYAGFFIFMTDQCSPQDMEVLNRTFHELTEYLHDGEISSIVCSDPRILHSAEEMRDQLRHAPSEFEGMIFNNRKALQPQSAPSHYASPYLGKLDNLAHLYETGSWTEAYHLTISIIHSIFSGGMDDRYCIYRVHGLLSFILVAIQKNASITSSISSFDYERRLFGARNMSELETEIKAIIDELISLSRTDNPAPSSIASEIHRYLDENYTNHELSLSMLSSEFSMSESSISRVFRETYGMTYLEYIQSLRIRKAKELLLTQSVKDVAKATGFWDAQALIRVFKKYEGITPGQYKDLHSEGS